MTSRDQRAKLPDTDDVDALFDKPTIERLAAIAGIPNDLAEKEFGPDLRAAVSTYLSDAETGLQAGEIRAALSALYGKIAAALEGGTGDVEAAAEELDSLPLGVVVYLQRQARLSGGDLPNSNEIRDPIIGKDRLRMLGAICASSAIVKEGRKRPGGRRSRSTLVVEVSSPRPTRGRPKNTEELMLCTSLGGIFERCTGRFPGRWRRTDSRGPFLALVSEVFAIINLRASADDVVKTYLAAMTDDSGHKSD